MDRQSVAVSERLSLVMMRDAESQLLVVGNGPRYIRDHEDRFDTDDASHHRNQGSDTWLGNLVRSSRPAAVSSTRRESRRTRSSARASSHRASRGHEVSIPRSSRHSFEAARLSTGAAERCGRLRRSGSFVWWRLPIQSNARGPSQAERGNVIGAGPAEHHASAVPRHGGRRSRTVDLRGRRESTREAPRTHDGYRIRPPDRGPQSCDPNV